MSIPSDTELLKLATDLEYVGFSTVEFRGKVVEAGWSIGDVINALVAYIMMGNNASQPKRVERAHNVERARTMTTWLAGKDVKKNAKTGNPITLGRLAKAYAPALLTLRYKLISKLRAQFPTSTPLPQADLAFLGYNNTSLCSESRDYVEKFGIIISRVAFPGLTDSELRMRNEGFARIAQDGLDRDPIMKALLSQPKPQALDAIMMQLHTPVPVSPLSGRIEESTTQAGSPTRPDVPADRPTAAKGGRT